MPRSSTGKWVQRAAATGGGRTYRGQRPVNWYASLVVIAVLGLISVIWARYEYQNPSSASSSKVQPTVGTKWFAAMGMNICGTEQAALPAGPTTGKPGMITDGQGTLAIAPTTSAQAGKNATLSQFISTYPGLTLTSSSLGYPKQHVFHNGDKCPQGTPDAGKAGNVQVAYWSSKSNSLKDHEIISDPGTLKPVDQSEITMNFLPEGAAIKKPPTAALVAMLKATAAAQSSSSTPTTSPTATTLPPSTPTTAAPTTSTTSGPTPSTTSTTSHR